MSAHHHAEPLPRAPLIGAACLVLATVVGVAAIRLAGAGPSGELPDVAIVAERYLHFADSADGAVVVTDISGQTVDRLEAGSAGFLRATLRGLARGRVTAGPEAPFVLRRLANGQLILSDPVSSRHVDLLAFGPTNAAAFGRYLQTNTTVATATKEAGP